MRSLIPSIVVGCLASCWAVGLTAGAPAAPPKPPPAPSSPSAADNEAAAKHAKRTLCLKQAKSKKLVGAQRTEYIKDCMGTA
jgi:hypothetical protein